MPYSVSDFKLAVISDEFSDEEVEEILRQTKVMSEGDIHEVVDVLKTHRPALYEKIESEFPLFQRR